MPLPAPCEPGAFHKRELPCLLAMLSTAARQASCVVVDGYVDLDERGHAGLGRKLWEELGRDAPVVGVGKTSFSGEPDSWELRRGKSASPLFVTSAGMEIPEARAAIASMDWTFASPPCRAGSINSRAWRPFRPWRRPRRHPPFARRPKSRAHDKARQRRALAWPRGACGLGASPLGLKRWPDGPSSGF